MMKAMITLFLSFILVTGVQAQPERLTEEAVPAHISNNFERAYPGVLTEEWTLENGLYKVNFPYGNRDYLISYMPDGTRMETTQEIKRREFPESVGEAIGEHLNSPFRIREARRVDHDVFGGYYEVTVRSQGQLLNLMVDDAGVLLQAPDFVYQE